MSTILDALKKSEESRKVSKAPSLQNYDAPYEKRHWPKFIAVILFLLLLIALALLWFKSSQSQTLSVKNSVTKEQKNQNPILSKKEQTGIIVSVVSYSKTPEQRFAIVNGKMTREGEFVQAGLKLISIDKQKVTFNHRGKIEVRAY